MRIFLVGLTGCGKTTTGKMLASKLQLPFVDSDEEIEEKEGMKISEIFEQFGEEHFRILESRMIRDLSKMKNAIISTGGGAACFYDNMTIMNVSGITIFLDLPVETICTRLYSQLHKNNRPMLVDKSYEELLLFLQSLYAERIAYYSEAKIIMNGNDITVSQIIEALETLD